jgi:hypothetical protein
MREKKIYICDKCGLQFDRAEDCIKHEQMPIEIGSSFRVGNKLTIRCEDEIFGQIIPEVRDLEYLGFSFMFNSETNKHIKVFLVRDSKYQRMIRFAVDNPDPEVKELIAPRDWCYNESFLDKLKEDNILFTE